VRGNYNREKFAIAALVVVLAVAVPRVFAARIANTGSFDGSVSMLESAQHQFGAGNYSGAIATLRSIVSQDDRNAQAFYWLGRCYYETQDLDEAIAHSEKAVALAPENSVYEEWLGRDYAAKADRDKSYFAARKIKKHFEKAVELDPANVAARRDLAEFCAQAPWVVGGDTDEAVTQIDAIAKINPIEGRLARASFDVEALKRPDLADNEYKQILAANPKDAHAYFDAIVFYQTQNRPADMNAAIEAVARLNPKDSRLSFYRAEAMVMAGKELNRAADNLKAYLASTPDRSDWPTHAAAREWLGRVYEMQGHPAEAAEQYRASLQLDPGRTSAQERLEKLEKQAL
jgi:tetratricopeptide (TPR) repeat protein